jgi:hypothetical protein
VPLSTARIIATQRANPERTSAMSLTAIHFTITGTAPYSQSQYTELFEPRGKKESPDQYDKRCWRMKAHVDTDGESIVIPAHGLQQALVAGAQKGRLKPTAAAKSVEVLHKRISNGTMIPSDAKTNLKLSNALEITILANSDGKRGSGKRVLRRFPVWNEWTAEFDVMLLDETLTADDLIAAANWAGLVVGIGRFRAENGGHNGRWQVAAAKVYDMHEKKLKKAA